MFLSRNKKNNVYPCKPQFYYIKVGFKRVKIIKVCFRDVSELQTTIAVFAERKIGQICPYLMPMVEPLSAFVLRPRNDRVNGGQVCFRAA